MKYKNQLRFDEVNFFIFRRALLDLRSGIPIYIKDLGITIASPETISRAFFERFFSDDAYFMISESRAKYFNWVSNCISLEKVRSQEIYDFINYNVPIENIENVGMTFAHDPLALLKLVKLLPNALISKIKIEGLMEITIEDLMEYKYLLTDSLELTERAQLKLKHYEDIHIDLALFRSSFTTSEHYAIIVGDSINYETPFVRIHSSCFTGDVLGSLSCDCMDQLHIAIHFLAQNGGGIIIYINQEGRGIGLAAKLKAYNLQQKKSLDTFEANLVLGFEEDERSFSLAAQMLAALSISAVKLLTNNPQKISSLESLGIKVDKVCNLEIDMNEFNEKYLKTKADKMAHMIKV